MRKCPRCQLRYYDESVRCLIDGTELEEQSEGRIGQLLGGRYRIESVLGEGGMATVYRAHHTLVDRPLAVKIMHPHLALNDAQRERMRREGRSASALSHPNIIEIYDYGETPDGAPYLVMELLEGKALRELMRKGPMPFWMVAELGGQVARGLARAHDFGIVHRDLKPENIFVSHDDHGKPLVKLVDFGIARALDEDHLTKLGTMVGTPQYMAPERATDPEAGASSDLYSLGVLLFEMVTGQLPFQASNAPGFILAHIHNPIPRVKELTPHCPDPLARLISQLLGKAPEDRPVDAHQVVEVLAALRPEGLDEPPPSRTTRIEPRENTAVLDRWVARVEIFERLLDEGYPSKVERPAELVSLVASLRETVTSIRQERERGVTAQHRLDAMEVDLRESGKRLGRAAEIVGQDLSRSREELRVAAAEVEARKKAVARAEEVFRVMLDEVGHALDEGETAQSWERARVLADQAGHWQHNEAACQRSVERSKARQREVSDLEFQVSALRDQLEHLEADLARRAEEHEAVVERGGETIRQLEERLLELSARFCRPFRDEPRLASLLAQLPE